MQDRTYAASVADRDGALLMSVPFLAATDAEAAQAGRGLLGVVGDGYKVRVTDLRLGRWEDGSFTTEPSRLVYESAKI